MRNQLKFMSLAGFAAAFAFAAVQVGAQSRAQAQAYQLVSINGRPLPVAVETEDDCREEVTDAVLTLRDSGEWLLEISQREVCGDAVEDEEIEKEQGTYTMEAETVRFSEDGGDDDADETDGAGDAEEDDAEEDDAEEEVAEDRNDAAAEVELEDLAVGTMTADGFSVRLQDGQTVVLFRR